MTMAYSVELTHKATKDLMELHHAGRDEELRKFGELMDELRNHPESGEGKVEELGHVMNGEWSRRLNHENRVVYTIDEAARRVTVLSLLGHYNDH